MKRILISLLFVLLFTVVSCGGDDSSSVKSGLDESCTQTADCEVGLRCIDLVCVDDNGNTGDTGNSGNTGDTGDTGDSDATCTGSDKFCHSHDGLNWSDASSEILSYSYNDAIKYCQDLGGHLPTISELRTLIQNCSATETGGSCGVTDSCLSYSECRNDDCSGCNNDSSGKYSVFGDNGLFWSSSVLSDHAGNAWRVDFANGRVDYDGRYGGYDVRCVR